MLLDPLEGATALSSHLVCGHSEQLSIHIHLLPQLPTPRLFYLCCRWQVTGQTLPMKLILPRMNSGHKEYRNKVALQLAIFIMEHTTILEEENCLNLGKITSFSWPSRVALHSYCPDFLSQIAVVASKLAEAK